MKLPKVTTTSLGVNFILASTWRVMFMPGGWENSLPWTCRTVELMSRKQTAARLGNQVGQMIRQLLAVALRSVKSIGGGREGCNWKVPPRKVPHRL